VEQIATAVEVAPHTLYRHFPIKEDVLFADTPFEDTLRRGLRSGLKRLWKLCLPPPPPPRAQAARAALHQGQPGERKGT